MKIPANRVIEFAAEDVSSTGFTGMRFTLRLPPGRGGGRPVRVPAAIPGLGKLSREVASVSAISVPKTKFFELTIEKISA